jgi:hypothetical protein
MGEFDRWVPMARETQSSKTKQHHHPGGASGTVMTIPGPRFNMDEFERRSRLISLVYEVLQDMKLPSDEATIEAILSDLSRAFLDKAAALSHLEGGPPRADA